MRCRCGWMAGMAKLRAGNDRWCGAPPAFATFATAAESTSTVFHTTVTFVELQLIVDLFHYHSISLTTP